MATRIAERAPSRSLRSHHSGDLAFMAAPVAALDTLYARTKSFGQDLGLLVRIILVVVRGTGM